MKIIKICPIFKKNINLDKENDRPVSIFRQLTKKYESILCKQTRSQ